MTRDAWDPAQYERFRDERARPFLDLLALVRPCPGMRVVDLGCGTGELTARLHDELAAGETLGVDRSEAMLARARPRAKDGLRFEAGDIAAFAARAAYDLVFSNAALHWIDDHAVLFAGLTAALRPGGQLAVQMPANFDHPAHVVAAEVAGEAPFRDALGGHARSGRAVLRPEEYALLLERLGYAEQHVRLQVYGHRLAARDEVVEWVKGTLLTDYQRRLPAELYARFVARYRERLLPALEDTRPYFFTFKRVLLWAQR
ncbi:MAG: methyltransferase domain-containing protein [Deltaproteobacteria bacterium]|nr:MAG: methyltransferase domain-containing protein [Deltaproteobacteria bacterium]